MQIFFQGARPALLVLTVLSLGYSAYRIYSRGFRDPRSVRVFWISAAVAVLLALIPTLRGG